MEIKISKHVNASLDRTFYIFTDVNHLQDHIPGLAKVVILSDVTRGPGTRWRETRLASGRPSTKELEISKLDRNKSFEVHATSKDAEYHTVYHFTPSNGGTDVELICSSQPRSLTAKVLSSLRPADVRNRTQKTLEDDMNAMKAVCEKRF